MNSAKELNGKRSKIQTEKQLPLFKIRFKVMEDNGKSNQLDDLLSPSELDEKCF
jgi:hypothetical protein